MLPVCSRIGTSRPTSAGANARDLAALLFAVALLSSAPAAALDLEPAHGPHVRAESREMQQLVDEASHRSPTFRSMVTRLDRSDVIVYLRYRAFTGLSFSGRIGILSAVGGQSPHHAGKGALETPPQAPPYRFLVVEIACNQPKVVQMATLGHELCHALEIAAAADVVNPASLARHYARIGLELTDGGSPRTFETAEAAEIGARVRREIVSSPNGT